MLKDKTHSPLACAAIADVLTVELHRSRIGDLQPGDDAQERRFTRARWPQQRDEAAARDVEIDVIERSKTPKGLGELRMAILMRAFS